MAWANQKQAGELVCNITVGLKGDASSYLSGEALYDKPPNIYAFPRELD
jgi:hypothetical protein